MKIDEATIFCSIIVQVGVMISGVRAEGAVMRVVDLAAVGA